MRKQTKHSPSEAKKKQDNIEKKGKFYPLPSHPRIRLFVWDGQDKEEVFARFMKNVDNNKINR